MTKQYGNATFGTMVSCLILGGKLLVFLIELLKNGDITALNIATSALVLDTLVTKSIPKEAQHSFSTCCFEGLLIFTFFLSEPYPTACCAFLYSDKNYISSTKVLVCFPSSSQI